MKNVLLLFFVCIGFLSVYGQDAYHTNLQDELTADYSLPAGDWVFFDTENAILNDAFSYGGSSVDQDETGQPFSRKVRHVISTTGNAPWDAGWGIRNNVAVQTGDVMLATFYIRSVNGDGKVNFFVENTTTFNKEVILTLPIGEEWRRYMVPFKAQSNYGGDGLTWGFHLAFQAQTIEVGGFTAINFENDAALEDLPSELNNQFYTGWEEDAPWRAEAAQRIETLRKADLTIDVKDSNGNPVENAGVSVNMIQHDFAFGSAITASRLPGNDADNVIYQNKIINLDGQGHGFNWVVFENDLKWDAWEEEWFVNKAELVNGIQWLVDQDIKIRGHTLVWPGEQYLPDDIGNNLGNPGYLKNRIDEHLEEVLTFPGVAGNIPEWDVLNEIVVNRTLENAFAGTTGYTTGRELYQEIFEKTRSLDANTGLWLNDYVTLTLNQGPGAAQYDLLKQFTGELVNAGVDIEGIGFQSHIGGFPNGIPSVLSTYDDFYNDFGLKAKVTEFDTPSFVTEELGATYLRDFLTATFSHPSMNGFLFWNFWDGATWLNEGSNLFRLDWSMTPAGDAFVDLVFDEWWTAETLTTEATGDVATRVFKGQYEISYACDGMMQRDTVYIKDAFHHEIICDNIATDIQDESVLPYLRVFPNPASERLFVEQDKPIAMTLRLLDLNGRTILQQETEQLIFSFPLNELKGMYFLEVIRTGQSTFKKIIVE